MSTFADLSTLPGTIVPVFTKGLHVEIGSPQAPRESAADLSKHYLGSLLIPTQAEVITYPVTRLSAYSDPHLWADNSQQVTAIESGLREALETLLNTHGYTIIPNNQLLPTHRLAQYHSHQTAGQQIPGKRGLHTRTLISLDQRYLMNVTARAPEDVFTEGGAEPWSDISSISDLMEKTEDVALADQPNLKLAMSVHYRGQYDLERIATGQSGAFTRFRYLTRGGYWPNETTADLERRLDDAGSRWWNVSACAGKWMLRGDRIVRVVRVPAEPQMIAPRPGMWSWRQSAPEVLVDLVTLDPRHRDHPEFNDPTLWSSEDWATIQSLVPTHAICAVNHLVFVTHLHNSPDWRTVPLRDVRPLPFDTVGKRDRASLEIALDRLIEGVITNGLEWEAFVEAIDRGDESALDVNLPGEYSREAYILMDDDFRAAAKDDSSTPIGFGSKREFEEMRAELGASMREHDQAPSVKRRRWWNRWF